MAATRKRTSVESLFNQNILAQIHSAIDSLLAVHGEEITASLQDSDTHSLKVGLAINIDASESAPMLDVDLSFTPRHVKDRRSIQCIDPNQTEFEVFTPAQMEERRAEAARKEAEAEANEPDEEKPKRKRKDTREPAE